MADKYEQEAVQGYPLAPPTMPRSDQESAPTTTNYQSQVIEMKKKKRMRCLAYTVLFAILQTAVILAFILVFVRIRTPRVRLSNVQVTNSVSGNIGLTAHVLIRNRNFGRYKYDSSIVTILSGTRVVGGFMIPDGRVRSRSTRRIDVLVSNLDTGNSTGTLALTVIAQLGGEIEFVRVIQRRRNAQLSCNMNLSNNFVHGLRCFWCERVCVLCIYLIHGLLFSCFLFLQFMYVSELSFICWSRYIIDMRYIYSIYQCKLLIVTLWCILE